MSTSGINLIINLLTQYEELSSVMLRLFKPQNNEKGLCFGSKGNIRNVHNNVHTLNQNIGSGTKSVWLRACRLMQSGSDLNSPDGRSLLRCASEVKIIRS